MPGIDPITIAALSLIVSVVSLGVSIILGIRNSRLANKAFKATQYPVLGTGISDINVSSYDKRSYLKYRVENHSKDITLLDVKLIIEIAKPNKAGFGFWSRQWFIYHTCEWDRVLPENHAIPCEVSPSIEDFLRDKFPYSLREEIPPSYANPPTFYLLRRPLELRLTVTYRPSVFGIEPLSKRVEYTVTQQYEPNHRPGELVWQIRKHGSAY